MRIGEVNRTKAANEDKLLAISLREDTYTIYLYQSATAG